MPPQIPPPFVKSVALEIDGDYELNNTPFQIDERKSKRNRMPFVGRTKHVAKFLEFLKSPKENGVFLVTGFRGMGKTSFVNHVIHQYKTANYTRRIFKWCDGKRLEAAAKIWRWPFYKKKRDKVKSISLTLAQNNPKELDILRLIVSSVHDEYRKHLRSNNTWRILDRFFGFWKQGLLSIALLVLPFVICWFPAVSNYISALADSQVSSAGASWWTAIEIKILCALISPEYKAFAVLLIISYGFFYCLLKLNNYIISKNGSAYNRIRRLHERCYNTLSIENDENVEATFPVINFKLFTGGEKRTKQFAEASNKEIEHELQLFLDAANEEHGLEFIFIFDELDKVDPVISNNDLYGDVEGVDKRKYINAYEKSVRDRKQAITSIITGLKNFFTTANARFIFIAGNEMFDASLADISDRQSSISSIFTFVFNIESLLKEKDLLKDMDQVNNLSLSDAIEFYLKAVLFNCGREEMKKGTSLYLFAQENYEFFPRQAGEAADENFKKVYFILQNFITYLTYRSNGSPKKLIKEIQEFIRVEDGEVFSQDQVIIGRLKQGKYRKNKRYLYFNYYDQYRIGFINYLYRPFLIRYGRSFKLYSDNLIVSTSYLFDHLIKFHPFAFSMSYLELVPEVLSTNKTPALRSHIRKIIDYLGANHIREIEVGLFDYKFNSRTLNEITYLSKISEQEAAAMNYTLDESYLVKLHQINKIKELRYTYSTFNMTHVTADKPTQVFSIAHLNATLGDLHFFDQEYDDAIVAYSDAIRPLTQQAISTMDLQEFITLNKNRLKIGLCFEKTSSYEDALAQYSNTSMDALRFMNYRINNEEFIQIKSNQFGAKPKGPVVAQSRPKPNRIFLVTKNSKNDSDHALYHSAALSDLLQMIQQGFLAQVYIQEKKSVAGLSKIKLFMSLGSYFKVTEGFLSHHSRNHIIKANAFLHAGHLMYFKNTDLHNHLHKDYNDLIPATIVDNLNLLHAQFGEWFESEKRGALPLYLYILALFETTAFSMNENYIKDQIIILSKHKNIAIHLLIEFKNLLNKTTENYRSIRYNYIAASLSAIGDTLLSHYKLGGKSEELYNKHRLTDLFDERKWQEMSSVNLLSDKQIEDTGFSDCLQPMVSNKFGLVEVLTCYYVAGRYYSKQGRMASAVFQYSKILYLLRLTLGVEKDLNKRKSFIEFLEATIIKPALQMISHNTENTDMHMLNKAVDLKLDPSYVLNNVSNHPETREIILLLNFVKLRICGKNKVNTESINTLISPMNSFATQHGRLLELSFYARYMENCPSPDFNSYVDSEEGAHKVTNNQIVENCSHYLYSRLSVLQIMDIYGTDYWMGYSYLAFTHMRVGRYLSKLKGKEALKKALKTELEKFLGKGSYAGLDATFHFAKAKTLYEKAIQLQSGGDAYRAMVDEMIYLEDDFNDSAYHFGAALDRYMMINGVFENRISKCKKEINNYEHFTSDSYNQRKNSRRT